MAKFCAKCGQPLVEGASFCASCGSKVIDNAAPRPAPQQPIPMQNQTAPVQPPYPQGAPLPQQTVPCPQPGSVPQPTGRRGSNLVLIIICAVLLIPSVFSGLFLVNSIRAFRGESGIGQSLDSLFSGKKNSAAAYLPDGAKLDTTASVVDVTGGWKGTFIFDELSGVETIEGVPSDIQERIAEIKSTPAPFEMTLQPNGKWEIGIDAMNGLELDSSDMKTGSSNAHLYQGPAKGLIAIHPDKMNEDGRSGAVTCDAAVGKDMQGKVLAGTIRITLREGSANVNVAGHFTARPDPD